MYYVTFIYRFDCSFGDIGKAIGSCADGHAGSRKWWNFPNSVCAGIFPESISFTSICTQHEAMRECIAGFYGMNYWIELGKLALLLIPALLLGLILRKPVIKLNDAFTVKIGK